MIASKEPIAEKLKGSFKGLIDPGSPLSYVKEKAKHLPTLWKLFNFVR